MKRWNDYCLVFFLSFISHRNAWLQAAFFITGYLSSRSGLTWYAFPESGDNSVHEECVCGCDGSPGKSPFHIASSSQIASSKFHQRFQSHPWWWSAVSLFLFPATVNTEFIRSLKTIWIYRSFCPLYLFVLFFLLVQLFSFLFKRFVLSFLLLSPLAVRLSQNKLWGRYFLWRPSVPEHVPFMLI